MAVVVAVWACEVFARADDAPVAIPIPQQARPAQDDKTSAASSDERGHAVLAVINREPEVNVITSATESASASAPAPAAAPASPEIAPAPATAPANSSPTSATPLTPLMSVPASGAIPPFGACCNVPACNDLLDLAPNTIGGLFGAGNGKIAFANIPHAQIATLQIPNAAESVLGRQIVADDSSPLPRDRVFFDYDYFYQVPFSPKGVNVNLFTTGLEKTFLDGRLSAEVRIPFGTTLDNDSLVSPGHVVHGRTPWIYHSGETTELGNVAIGAKALLIRVPDELAVSAGLFVSVPTADDLEVTGLLAPLHNPSATLRFKNQSVHVAPYVGALWTPMNRLFAQGFLQLDFDANGQQAVLENSGSSVDLGTLRDQTFIYCDANFGYWIVRDPTWNWAGMLEIDYNASLNRPDSVNVSPGQVNLTAGQGNVNLFDLLLGTTLRFQENKTITVAYGFALGAGQDEQFTRQVRVTLNWFF